MAFAKAPLKRFNDFNENDATAPPPGSYNPLFATDVGANAKISIGRLPRSSSRTVSPAPAMRRPPSPSPSRVPLTPAQRERCRTPMPGLHPNIPKGPTPQDKLAELGLKYQEAERKLKGIQKENISIQEQLAKLQEDKNNWVKTAETCQVTITELNASLQDLKAQLDKSTANEASTKEAFLKAELEWKTKASTLQSSIKELQHKLGEHVKKNTELEHILKRSEKENQILEAERQKVVQTLEEERSAHQATDKKCQLLEENMGKHYSVYQEELNVIKEERAKWQGTEAGLLESLRLSKGQIDSLRIAVQAEKSGRIHSEEKVVGLLKSLEKTENTIVALRAGWEVKERELMNEIQRLESCLKSYIENPTTLLDEDTNKMAKEVLVQRKSNAELKSKVDVLERIDSIRKQGVEIDLASALHSKGIEISPNVDTTSCDNSSEILDITSPLQKGTLHDTSSTKDLKQRVQELKASCCEMSSAVARDAQDLQSTRDLIAKIEEDNEKKRQQCLSIVTQDFENANDKKEPSSSQTSLDSLNNFRSPLSDEKWVSGGNLALGPTPASTNLGPDKSSSELSTPSPRGSSGRLLATKQLLLDPIEEEEEDKHK